MKNLNSTRTKALHLVSEPFYGVDPNHILPIFKMMCNFHQNIHQGRKIIETAKYFEIHVNGIKEYTKEAAKHLEKLQRLEKAHLENCNSQKREVEQSDQQ